jgi:hypothetical protein
MRGILSRTLCAVIFWARLIYVLKVPFLAQNQGKTITPIKG